MSFKSSTDTSYNKSGLSLHMIPPKKVLLLHLEYEQFSSRYNKHFQNKGHYSGLILELNSDPEKWPFFMCENLNKGRREKNGYRDSKKCIRPKHDL